MKKSIISAMAVATLSNILFSGTSSARDKRSNKPTYNHSGIAKGIKGYTPVPMFKRPNRALDVPKRIVYSNVAKCRKKYPSFDITEYVFLCD
jgi:hypothetical protein